MMRLPITAREGINKNGLTQQLLWDGALLPQICKIVGPSKKHQALILVATGMQAGPLRCLAHRAHMLSKTQN